MRILSFLNTKPASVICILLAIYSRVINVMFVSFTGRDKMILVMQSKSMMEGKGFSLPHYFTYNTEVPVYDYTPFWPPGYPILLAPFLKIFNYDVYWATTALDLVASIILIALMRKIALFLKFPLAAVNIVTLIAGCFEYAFISESLPTDTPSFVLFLAGFFLMLQAVQSEKLVLQKLFFASLFLFLPCAFRYSYPPLSISVPLIVMASGWYLKKKLLLRKGIIVLAATFLLIIAFLLLLKTTSGASSYIIETGRGFFPENLIHWAPVAPASFINLSFLVSQLLLKTNLTIQQCLAILEVINILMILSFIVIVAFLFFKKMFFASPDKFKWFLASGFFISLVTFAELGYLSLTYKSQKGFFYGWNYATESRYFAFVFIYLQLVFLGWIFLFPEWKKNILKKTIVVSLSLLLFIEVTHNIYFHTKVAFHFKEYKATRYKEEDYAYFNKLIRSVIDKNPGTEIFVAADNDHYYPLMASYLGHKGLFDETALNKNLPVVKKKTIMIAVLYDHEIAGYKPFLSNKNIRFLNRVAGVNFYMLELYP